MQGGLHPDFNIEWYEDLLSTLHAKYPKFQLHCFSPPEIHNIHLICGLDYETIMQRLKDAGLNSLPGGGGEILDDEVRKRVSTKCNTQEWLDVMRAVHKVGLISTATMMFGIGDKCRASRPPPAADPRSCRTRRGGLHRIHPVDVPTREHRPRPQDQRRADRHRLPANARRLAPVPRQCPAHPGLVADARPEARADALRFGADDMGSIMIEENVVSAAGANTCANEAELRYQIREAGFRPQQRDILYNYVDREGVDDLDRFLVNAAQKV